MESSESGQGEFSLRRLNFWQNNQMIVATCDNHLNQSLETLRNECHRLIEDSIGHIIRCHGLRSRHSFDPQALGDITSDSEQSLENNSLPDDSGSTELNDASVLLLSSSHTSSNSSAHDTHAHTVETPSFNSEGITNARDMEIDSSSIDGNVIVPRNTSSHFSNAQQRRRRKRRYQNRNQNDRHWNNSRTADCPLQGMESDATPANVGNRGLIVEDMNLPSTSSHVLSSHLIEHAIDIAIFGNGLTLANQDCATSDVSLPTLASMSDPS